MKRTIALILTAVLMLGTLAACVSPAASSTTPPVRTLSSTGNGEVYLTPDLAYIYVGVRSDADDVATALNKNNLQAQQVADAVKSFGVEAKDIQTTNFNVYPMTDYTPNGEVSRKYYVVENTVYITVRDLTKMGNLLDAVVRAGANSINSISFDVANKDEAVAQARDLAIQKAREQAEGMAKAAGVKLGAVQSVSISTTGGTVPIYEGKGGGAVNAQAASVPVAAGQLLISVDAYLTYEIK